MNGTKTPPPKYNNNNAYYPFSYPISIDTKTLTSQTSTPYTTNPFTHIPSDVTTSPLNLIIADIHFFFKNLHLIPSLFLPLKTAVPTPENELSPTWLNYRDMFLHVILVIVQVGILLTMPAMGILFWFLPGLVFLVLGLAMGGVTWGVIGILNGGGGGGGERCLVGRPQGMEVVNDERELWFFVNGVATGRHWLQSHLNLLARIFQREIVGIHNPTKGVIGDLIKCLFQRDFAYNTRDIRQGRAQLRAALIAPMTKKLVLIAHSQGAMEVGCIVDWLLSDLPQTAFSKLEIYTFGNAARHFNNPSLYSPPSPPMTPPSPFYIQIPSIPNNNHHSQPHALRAQVQVQLQLQRQDYFGGYEHGMRKEKEKTRGVISHIEHYVNTGDPVSMFGILRHTGQGDWNDGKEKEVYKGRIFKREGTGHLFGKHYLEVMFKLCKDQDGRWVVDENGNEFMNGLAGEDDDMFNDNGPRGPYGKRVKDVSRLWRYINGREPVG